MPKFLKITVLQSIIDVGLLPVFHHDDTEVAKDIVKACFDGGARVVEFTNRGDRASAVFSELASWRDNELPHCILGAGTILDPETAALYINSGADLIVGPTLNREIARTCNRRKILYIPGCQTPTEISEAEEHGADIIKLFPASVVTPRFVKAVLGPMPNTRLMPSGGVKYDRGEVNEWIVTGAVALNMGSDLIKKDLVEEGSYTEIRDRIKECLAWICEARERQGTKEVG